MIYRAKVRQLFQINKKLKKKSDQRNRPLITRVALVFFESQATNPDVINNIATIMIFEHIIFIISLLI